MKFKDVLKAWAQPNRLTALANRYGTDKGDGRSQRHHYTRVYDLLFRDRRKRPVRLLELGLLGWTHSKNWQNIETRDQGHAIGNRAPSLQMWLDYFPNAEVIGFDINDFSGVTLPRCSILRGDMGDRNDLARVAARGPFDIIIDDASHASHHQQIALGYLFRHVAAGGFYVIEDLQAQPPAIEKSEAPKTRDVLRRAQLLGEFVSPYFLPHEREEIEKRAAWVKLFDSLSPGPVPPLDATDALAVISRR